MVKSESPPLQMIVEKGPRLAPATPADAERLDTWRIGSKVSVQFVRNGSRPMERKWWSILGLVINQCDVPWTTKESASQAIKLALGLVDYAKTVHGKFMQWPKSLTELTDPELDDAVRDMMDLIHKMTGIDPETLKKESADAGEDDDTSPDATPPASGDESEGDSQAASAQQESAAAGLQEDGAIPDDTSEQSDAAAPSSTDSDEALKIADTKRDCIERFLDLATDKTVPDPKERQEALVIAKDEWKRSIDDHTFLKQVVDVSNKVIKGELAKAKASEYLNGLVR